MNYSIWRRINNKHLKWDMSAFEMKLYSTLSI